MNGLGAIAGIEEVPGVDQYVWVDASGSILAHDAEAPGQLAQMTVSCAGPLHAMGKNNFKSLCFLRKNQANIYIFPVGNGYVGVIKQESAGDAELVKAVTDYLSICFSQGGK